VPGSLFAAPVIAMIWDFDQTLIPGYQQDPLFREYGEDGPTFWGEVNRLRDHYEAQGLAVQPDTLYLNHILTYVRRGRMAGLTNKELRRLGAELTFYPGLPDFLQRCVAHVRPYAGITVEHYIVSTGLRQIILGSEICTYRPPDSGPGGESLVKGVWASEFIDDPAEPGFGQAPTQVAEVRQVGYALDDTSKTRAIWEINKGTNVNPAIQVNDRIAPEDRRVPLRNMIYIADGPSDVPVFSILNQNGGRTLGVYNPDPDSEQHYLNVKRLRDQERVQHFAEADYRPGTNAYRWIMATLDEIAQAIVADREALLREQVSRPGGHAVKPTATMDAAEEAD
jgi:hypothetical protein